PRHPSPSAVFPLSLHDALPIYSTHLGVPVTMAEAAQAPAAGTPFRVTKHPVYLLLGLISVSRPNLEDVLAGQVGTGASVASLQIDRKSTRLNSSHVSISYAVFC